MASLSLYLLGRFQAILDGQPVTGFESNKVRALLAYLAIEADRPHSREALVGLLWPNQPDRAAHNNLRQALANLRRAIHDSTAQPPFLRIARETIQFNAVSDYRLDVAAFTSLLTACEQHRHRRSETCKSCAQRLQEAAETYQGNFLEQFFLSDSEAFEEWALVKREELRRLALNAFYRLAEHHEWRGAYEQVYQYATRQLQLDAWREEAHRQVMRALALSGQRSAALAQYETCRRILSDELGVEPALETTAVYEHVRDGAGVLVTGGIRAHERPSARLPIRPTPLVGREDEATFTAAWVEGHVMTLEQAIAYALIDSGESEPPITISP